MLWASVLYTGGDAVLGDALVVRLLAKCYLNCKVADLNVCELRLLILFIILALLLLLALLALLYYLLRRCLRKKPQKGRSWIIPLFGLCVSYPFP